MKHALLFSFLGLGMLPVSNQFTEPATNVAVAEYATVAKTKPEGFNLFSQEPGNEKMLAVVFKAQDFCRAELKDLEEFDVQYSVVSATVYFSGANFRGVEKGTISSNSLKPIRSLMDRCITGSMVVFDNVKVVGPDKQVRTIAGLSLMLR